jgi:predicted nucleotidyltransferase
LFGSYAHGQPKPGSDVDLLVIMETPDGDWPLTKAILKSLSPFRFGIDVLVRSQIEVEKRISLGDWFMEDVITKGKVVYERHLNGQTSSGL